MTSSLDPERRPDIVAFAFTGLSTVREGFVEAQSLMFEEPSALPKPWVCGATDEHYIGAVLPRGDLCGSCQATAHVSHHYGYACRLLPAPSGAATKGTI